MPGPRIPENFDQTKLWQFLIDYHFLENDPFGLIKYENREPGCIIGLFTAYRTMLSNHDISLLDTTVNPEDVINEIVNRVKIYHLLVTNKVNKLNSGNISGSFRSGSVHFGLTKNNSTIEGIEYLASRKFVRGPSSNQEIPLYYSVEDMKIKSSKITASIELENIFKLLCARLIEDLRQCEPEERLKYIAEFLQDAMALHPFSDANNRTLVILLLNDLLFSIKETPTVFMEANVVDAFDIPSLVEKIKQAQDLYLDIVNNGRMPKAAKLEYMTARGLFHIAAGAGELNLMEKIVSTINSQEKKDLLKIAINGNTALGQALTYEQKDAAILLLKNMGMSKNLYDILSLLTQQHNDKSQLVEKIYTKIQELNTEEIEQVIALCKTTPIASNNLTYLYICIAENSNNSDLIITHLNKHNFSYTIQELGILVKTFKSIGKADFAINCLFKMPTNLRIDFIKYDSLSNDIPHELLINLLARSLFGVNTLGARKYLIETTDINLFSQTIAESRALFGKLPNGFDIYFLKNLVDKTKDSDKAKLFAALRSSEIAVEHFAKAAMILKYLLVYFMNMKNKF